jgi:hypothetical protein
VFPAHREPCRYVGRVARSERAAARRAARPRPPQADRSSVRRQQYHFGAFRRCDVSSSAIAWPSSPHPAAQTLRSPRKRRPRGSGSCSASVMTRSSLVSSTQRQPTGINYFSSEVVAKRLAARAGAQGCTYCRAPESGGCCDRQDHVAGRAGSCPRHRSASPSFEPVSAETQPVSGSLLIQISDIENLSSRDWPRDCGLRPESLKISRWRPDSCPLTCGNVGTFEKVRNPHGETSVAGWRASPDRTGLQPEFPAGREFCREFRRF